MEWGSSSDGPAINAVPSSRASASAARPAHSERRFLIAVSSRTLSASSSPLRRSASAERVGGQPLLLGPSRLHQCCSLQTRLRERGLRIAVKLCGLLEHALRRGEDRHSLASCLGGRPRGVLPGLLDQAVGGTMRGYHDLADDLLG